MKRLLLAALAILLITPAHAGWNIKQKADGEVVWENQDGVQIGGGSEGLVVRMSDVSTAATSYVISHKPGIVAKAYITLHTALAPQSDAPSISFYLLNPQGLGVQVSGAGGVITPTTTGPGLSNSVTFLGTATSRRVTSGSVIGVVSDGGSTGVVDATVTIVVE